PPTTTRATSTTANAPRHSISTATSYPRSARCSICWKASIAPPWTRRPAGSDNRPSGSGLRFGELTLPLAERFLGAAAAPVPGNRGGPLGVDTAFLADIGPQVVHDGLRLAVDENLANCVVGQGLQCGSDGRDGRFVARQQVPVGRGVWRVGAAGPHQVGRLTGGRGLGPRPGDAVRAMHDEVDGDLAALGIDAAHGVGADGGPLFGG